jgi:hypothetical protein
MLILEILIKGYIFLFSVVIFNYVLRIFKIKNWYFLLNNFKNPQLKLKDIISLFVIYPLFLGYLIIILNF